MFAALFNSICICSCGRCCSAPVLCDQCEIDTLRTNGLPESLASEIHGLDKQSHYEKLTPKLRELIKQEREKYEQQQNSL